MEDSWFRKLSEEEVEEFKQYARENDPPDLKSWGLYHPVCREVWKARGIQPVADV